MLLELKSLDFYELRPIQGSGATEGRRLKRPEEGG